MSDPGNPTRSGTPDAPAPGGSPPAASRATHCGLCFLPLGHRGGDRCGGLDLCAACVQGVDLAQRLAYRGFGFQQRQVVPLGSEGSNFPSFGHLGPGSGRSTYRVTERIERPGQAPVRTEKQIQVHDLDLKTTLEGLYPLVLLGGLPRSIPLEVTFNRQGEGGSLRSLFRREPTVGDPLFDPVVFVDARRSAKLSALLSAEGLQSVIMEVVGGRGSVSIKGNAVRIHYEVLRWEDLPPEGEARRNLALVMHYCDLYCQHLERPQEMAWPPSTF